MGVRLDSRGVLAHYAEWVGRRTGRAVGGLGPQDSTALLFAADELLLHGQRLKFCDVPRVADQDVWLSLAAADFSGDVVVTSDMAAAVAALAVREGGSLDLISHCAADTAALVAGASFDTAALLVFQSSRWSPCKHRSWGPGTYDVVGDGYFRLKIPERTLYTRPTLTVSGARLELTLFDDRRAELDHWTGDDIGVDLPEWSTCYLRVSSPGPYRISTAMTYDTFVIPGVRHEIETLPKWWSDPPPLRLTRRTTQYLHDLRPAEGPLVFAADGVLIELIDRSGQVIRRARPTLAGLLLDTIDLDAGPYVVQLTHPGPYPALVRLVPALLAPADPPRDGAAQPTAAQSAG